MAAALARRLCGPGALRAAWRGAVSLPVHRSDRRYMNLACALQTSCYVSTPRTVMIQQSRQNSFFNTLTADELWRGAMGDTGPGAKKGRGKRVKKRKRRNLNVGQVIGEGHSGFLWPGLNAPLEKSGVLQPLSQRNKMEQEKRQSERIQQRDAWEKRRKMKVKRERGWTGLSWGGVSLGCPDPGPNGETYEDFDSRVIEVKPVFNMTANEGRKRSFSALVVVGNGNGAAGFALGKATDKLAALRKARNRAVHYLRYIERYQDHTIYHDITTTFKKTTIRMRKQNKGYGLCCHRAIITMCKLIGITDMYAKLSGSNNLLNLTKAFFNGLAQQETHQDLADMKSLYVVEFREECGALPIVVASPCGTIRKEPEDTQEVPDTRLEWSEVRAAQGMKRSVWANVRRMMLKSRMQPEQIRESDSVYVKEPGQCKTGFEPFM